MRRSVLLATMILVLLAPLAHGEEPGQLNSLLFDAAKKARTQEVIEDREVKPFGGIYSLEFDAEGAIDVFFVPIRPGTYEFYVENYRQSGMLGTIEVK